MREDVTFTSNGNHIVGQLHLPDVQEDASLPGVVVVGPASSVKGQVPTIYAERLAQLGYAALVFDHSSYGESEGWPRSDEDPFAKIEDIKNAVTFLVGHDKIDGDRLILDFNFHFFEGEIPALADYPFPFVFVVT